MIYLYAHTNDKNLDSLRRIGALYRALESQNIEAEILVNDYRAQMWAKSLGLPLATTIETILDIDAVAKFNDSVVVDTSEDISIKINHYLEYFDKFIAIKPCNAKSEYKEIAINPYSKESLLIDNLYLDNKRDKKSSNATLIFGDSDPTNELIKHQEFFMGLNLNLYWGEYFYIKNEEPLAKVFNTIYESDEYQDAILDSKVIITSIAQSALEASLSGASVIFLESNKNISNCLIELFDTIGISRVSLGDKKRLIQLLNSTSKTKAVLEPNFSKIIDILKS